MTWKAVRGARRRFSQDLRLRLLVFDVVGLGSAGLLTAALTSGAISARKEVSINATTSVAGRSVSDGFDAMGQREARVAAGGIAALDAPRLRRLKRSLSTSTRTWSSRTTA